MLRLRRETLLRRSVIGCLVVAAAVRTLDGAQAPAPAAARTDEQVVITAADCTVDKLGAAIPIQKIGEPVRRVALAPPSWTAETATAPAYCRVDGVIDPIDTSATARPINFGVALPAHWNRRSVQMGGGGINGIVPGLTGGGPGAPSWLARGMVTYGSDSGHQAGFGPPGARGAGGARAGSDARAGGDARPGGAGPASGDEWALNDEAIANLGYMQMKKTHDAAMV